MLLRFLFAYMATVVVAYNNTTTSSSSAAATTTTTGNSSSTAATTTTGGSSSSAAATTTTGSSSSTGATTTTGSSSTAGSATTTTTTTTTTAAASGNGTSGNGTSAPAATMSSLVVEQTQKFSAPAVNKRKDTCVLGLVQDLVISEMAIGAVKASDTSLTITEFCCTDAESTIGNTKHITGCQKGKPRPGVAACFASQGTDYTLVGTANMCYKYKEEFWGGVCQAIGDNSCAETRRQLSEREETRQLTNADHQVKGKPYITMVATKVTALKAKTAALTTFITTHSKTKATEMKGLVAAGDLPTSFPKKPVAAGSTPVAATLVNVMNGVGPGDTAPTTALAENVIRDAVSAVNFTQDTPVVAVTESAPGTTSGAVSIAMSGAAIVGAFLLF